MPKTRYMLFGLVVAWVADVFSSFLTLMCVTLISSFPTMWLWNSCLVDAVSGIHEISWSQAWGICMLASVISSCVALVKK
jgi:hypothetical protein